MTTETLVSVVIPTRNRWALLARAALRSVRAQTGVATETIVVDDGSTDPMPEELSHGGDVRVVRLPDRRGVAAARNAGIGIARGDWIAFLDDDDLWSPDKLRAQLDAAERDAADMVYAGVVSLDANGTAQYAFPLPPSKELPRRLLAGSALPAGCSNVIARTALVRELGGFDEELHQLADWDLWIRLAWAGRVTACDARLVGYVEHEENMLLMEPRDVRPELDILERKHRELRRAEGVELDRAAFSHWVAWGHLRRRRRLRAAKVYLQSGIANRRPRDVALAAAFVLRWALPLGALRRAVAPSRAPLAQPEWLGLYR
jgi:glycosyltransferase involved in cell wall biosynthesis